MLEQTTESSASEQSAAATDGEQGANSGLPEFNSIVEYFRENWEALVWAAGKIAVAILIGLIVYWIVFFLITRVVKHTRWRVDDIFIKRLRRPARLIFPLLAVMAVVPGLFVLSEDQISIVRHIISLVTIAAVTWLVVALIGAVEEFVKSRHTLDTEANFESRRIHTQVSVLAKALMVFIVIISIAVALMTFPGVKEIGMSVLASAGIAGLAIGLAARPVLENLIAGVQIALTQPIKLDDVVVIEGEWGRVEEITTTYVVIKIWDLRRLIVPFSKVISDSFENWTRKSTEIFGTVYIYTDYTVDTQALRDEVNRIVQAHDKWDGEACGLILIDAQERTCQLRALVSAANSGDVWELRCHLREKLIEYLQRESPQLLPRTRVELGDDTVKSLTFNKQHTQQQDDQKNIPQDEESDG